MMAHWLAILCGQVQGVRCGLVLLASDVPGTFVPGAIWPEAHPDLAPLVPVAERALQQRRGLLQPQASGAGAFVAYPVELAGEIKGAVVLDAGDRSPSMWQQAQRQLHWASAWLMDLFRQDILQQREQALQRVQLVNAVAATALQAPSLREAALALTNELALRLACDRVSMGLEDEGRVRLAALSHTASFDRRSNLAVRIAEAMDEVVDTGAPVAWPAAGDAELLAGAQAALARESGAQAVWSVPLIHRGETVGVLCFERRAALDDDTLALSATLGEWLGPVVALAQAAEIGPWQRARILAREAGQALFGPGRHGIKLLVLAGCLSALVLGLVQGSYRVSAKTVVEGAVLRATQAPFDGYLAESRVRAGDTVHRGELLARLEDRELLVERARWEAEREQHLRKLRQAQAQHDWSAMRVLAAQAEQAAAQVEMVGERLQRTRLLAPFDGVVVSGDLRQLIGTPVEQGKLLFEIAPLDAYRVVLQVDERDAGAIRIGQSGDLALTGLPGERLHFVVRQLTPVAVAEDGRNFFRVEAQLDSTGEMALLRPGMEGIGKVQIGERRLLWIAFHPLLDWLRVSWWNWLP
jgi:multidrug resistance efflux pump